MLKGTLFLILSFGCLITTAQNLSSQYDSLTSSHIQELQGKQKKNFKSIVSNRRDISLQKRMDSLSYDYLFIQEVYNRESKSIIVIEGYFKKGQQSPDFVFINNERNEYYTPHDYNWCKDQLHGKIKEYEYSLRPLLKLHKSFQSIQELAYRKNQLLEIPHVWSPEWTEEFNEGRKKSLEASYQIMTMIEKGEAIQVSVRYSPRKAVFQTVICQSGF
jgi:hypothetical protein